jgi:hypothetical protein
LVTAQTSCSEAAREKCRRVHSYKTPDETVN